MLSSLSKILGKTETHAETKGFSMKNAFSLFQEEMELKKASNSMKATWAYRMRSLFAIGKFSVSTSNGD